MKKYILWGIGLLVLLMVIWFVYGILTTKKHSPAGVAEINKDDVHIVLNYCRPYKKGRLIFGSPEDEALVPFGQYWRTGANEATEIEFNREVLFNEEKIPAGRYRLYTIPGEDEWIIALNSELGKWGYYEADPLKDVIRTRILPLKSGSTTEQLTIELADQNDQLIHLVIRWDDTEIRVPIRY
jgi:hypothetical protein